MNDTAGNTANSIQSHGNETIVAFAPQELARIQEIKKRLQTEGPQAIISYGIRAQRDISEFSDTILNQVRTSDTSNAAGILNSLVVKVKETGIGTLGEEGGFLSKIPGFSSLVNPFGRFIQRYESLSIQIEKIADELNSARVQMLRDITLLDIMFTRNQEYKKTLELYIAAGEQTQKEMEEATLPGLKAKAELTQQQDDIQAYNDFTEFLDNLDKKLADLRVSRMITLQTGLQIKLIQSGNRALAEKIQSSILNTIPLWKNQVAIAVTLLRQKKALKLQNNVNQASNMLLEKNAALLKENTIGIAKEQQRGMVDIETLKQANNNLIATIEDALQIQAAGKEKRKQAEEELLKIEEELKGRLGVGRLS